MKISKIDFPKKSLLFKNLNNYDYIDSFGGVFSDNNNTKGIDEVTMAFAKPSPKWVNTLMYFRNKIAGLVGLKTGDTKQTELHKESSLSSRKKVGFFNIYEKTNNEIILGENDKHLDFRVSVYLDVQQEQPLKKMVAISTVVKYNNWMGPVYFFFVKPLHQLIVPAMLKRNFNHF